MKTLLLSLVVAQWVGTNDNVGIVEVIGPGGGTFTGAVCWTDGTQSVCVDSPAAGDLRFYGSGGTNNENLVCDFETTANTVGVSTSTGVTLIDAGSIGFSAGTITGSTLTDGTLSCTAGTCTGGVSVTSTTLTDGTASLSAGALTGLVDIETSGQTYQDAITTSTPSGATQTIDWDDGNYQILDLEDATGDVAMTLSNPQIGRYLLKVIQDGGGAARTLTWVTTILWKGGVEPTITAGNDAVDLIECFYDGANYLCAITQDIKTAP